MAIAPLEVLALICDHQHWPLQLHASEVGLHVNGKPNRKILTLTTLDVLNEQGDLIACAPVGGTHNLQQAATECVRTLRALIDERAA